MGIDHTIHLEFVVKGFVIEEDPGVLVFAIPLIL